MNPKNGLNNFNNYKDVVELTHSLVKINSENPNVGESGVEEFLLNLMQELGFEIRIFPYKEKRNSILACFPPTSLVDKSDINYFVFSGHMDTVPGYLETEAEVAPIREGKVFGRGSCDMKGGIAGFISAVIEFLEKYELASDATGETPVLQKIKRGICLIFTADEEMGCNGVRILAEQLSSPQNKFLKERLEFGINAEPTDLMPIIGHKGIVWFLIDFFGKAAHASVPYMGDNAIEKAVKFISALESLKEELKSRGSDEPGLFTPPTLNVGQIHGGVKTNVVPDKCRVEVDRRLVPVETSDQALKEIISVLESAGLSENDYKILPINPGESYFLPNGTQNSFFTEINNIVSQSISSNPQTLTTNNKAESDSNGKPKFMEGYTESDYYLRLMGLPTIILGPGSINQAHQKVEYVEIEQLKKVKEIYSKILERFVLKL